MSRVNCHIPIKLCITGRPSDTQLDQLTEDIVHALTARISFAEETISSRIGGSTISADSELVREEYNPSRESAALGGYLVPSYQEGGAPASVPVEKTTREGWVTGLELWLETNTNIDPAAIDWRIVLPQLLDNPPWETVTMVEASNFERYMMFLQTLASEVQSYEPVEGAKPVDINNLAEFIMDYITEVPQEVFSEETFYVHSEKFLTEWLEKIRKIKFVPEGFKIESFQPESNEKEIAEERHRILSDFLYRDASFLMMRFVLDQWTHSRRSPEEWLANLDLDDYRADLVQHLTDKFMELAEKDPDYMQALRVANIEQQKYKTVAGIYRLANESEQANENLHESLSNKPMDQLTDDFEWAVAGDPYRYWELNQAIADATHNFLRQVRPDGKIALRLLEWTEGVLSAIEVPEEFKGLIMLSELLSYFYGLKHLIKKEKERARHEIAEDVLISFPELASIVRNYIEHAERFIHEEWIPELKKVAIDKLTRNRNELQQIYDNWDIANDEFISRLLEGAEAYEQMARGLEDGLYESIELNGEVVTFDGASHLWDAAQFMRDEAEMRSDPKRAVKIKEELKEAIDVYNTVRADIEDDEYDPLNYSASVYKDTLQRLGISEFPEYTTVGMVLKGQVVAKENPFLAETIVLWKWKEGVERKINTGLLMAGLGILTVAAMVFTGGIAGLALGALDIGIGIGMGIKGIADANELLNMARLDIRQDIRGISVEDAEKALKYAWIGFGVTVVVSAGVATLYARAAFKARGGRVVRPSGVGVAVKVTQKESEAIARLQATLRKGGHWTDLSARDRRLLGNLFHKTVEPLSAYIFRGVGGTHHGVEITTDLIQGLRKTSRRVLFTEGKLRIGGRVRRVDLAEINFQEGTISVIDLTSVERASHLAKTRGYRDALQKLTGFQPNAIEMRYVGDDESLLYALTEAIVQ